MCIYYYLHHHHMPPCSREIEYVVQYEFCPNATRDPDTKEAVPCSQACFDHSNSVDYTNPCATGGCLVSPECSSGSCRVEDLGGRWKCCRCRRGGNSLRWCNHKKKESPDTFCYHQACEGCTTDA
ncbi:hypothetical protein B0T11DRAFT_328813 [Plectosphaerella cucumerina]|jgi:hypothetical protein|uniref:Uncharacterized protein n=1 Tax=Plectosphaerella cucumerina TaxID=40658 RepID=A0A8K0TDU6_9PEZI|nr:hypothetical protein B0T11DRAFT_328813 [Plectosphaerella cucumerina]